MRAPGMALFIVAFVTAVFAAFGVDRVAAGASRRFVPAALVAGLLAFVILAGLAALLGWAGVIRLRAIL